MIEDHGEYIKKRRKMDEAKLKYINQKMNELKYFVNSFRINNLEHIKSLQNLLEDAERIKDSISLNK